MYIYLQKKAKLLFFGFGKKCKFYMYAIRELYTETY